VESLRRELPAAGQDAEGDREVKGGRLLRQLGWGKIHDNSVVGPRESGVDHRPGDAMGALSDGGVGHADEHRCRQGTAGNIDLHVDRHRINPEK